MVRYSILLYIQLHSPRRQPPGILIFHLSVPVAQLVTAALDLLSWDACTTSHFLNRQQTAFVYIAMSIGNNIIRIKLHAAIIGTRPYQYAAMHACIHQLGSVTSQFGRHFSKTTTPLLLCDF